MNEIVSNAKMDPETGPSTETRPDVAPESVTKPTAEVKTEPAKASNRDVVEIMGELAIEPGADNTTHHASQSTSEPTSKAPASSRSAADVPLPLSPPLLPGFSFSSLSSGSLFYTGKPIVPDVEALAETTCSLLDQISGPRPYEMHSKQIKTDNKGKKIDISKWLQTTQESRESLDSCLRPSTLISAMTAPAVVTEDSMTALSGIDLSDDDTTSYHTALEEPALKEESFSNVLSITSVCELDFLQDRDFSDQQLAIIGALDLSLQSGIPDAAEQAAAKIDSLCPPTDQEEEVEEWLWMLWEIFLDAVRSPGFYFKGPKARVLMLGILKCLQLRAKGTVKIEGEEQRLWRDLPSFPYCMDACFDDPTTRQTRLDFKTQWSWCSLNAFAAGCLGGSIGGPYDQAMYAMTTALEEEPSSKYGVAACRVDVVRCWISSAGGKLFRWALENVGFDGPLEKDSPQYVERGPLYHGPPMMCLQRWGFWIERLEQLRKKGSVPDEVGRVERLRLMASIVALDMRYIEGDMGYTLSVPTY